MNLKQAAEKITWQIYNVSLWIKYVITKKTVGGIKYTIQLFNKFATCAASTTTTCHTYKVTHTVLLQANRYADSMEYTNIHWIYVIILAY